MTAGAEAAGRLVIDRRAGRVGSARGAFGRTRASTIDRARAVLRVADAAARRLIGLHARAVSGAGVFLRAALGCEQARRACAAGLDPGDARAGLASYLVGNWG